MQPIPVTLYCRQDSRLTHAGCLLASYASPYATTYPEPGFAEQEPTAWWTALGLAVTGAVQSAGMAVMHEILCPKSGMTILRSSGPFGFIC